MHLKKKELLLWMAQIVLKYWDQIHEGTVIFTAHGVSPEVKKRARDKGLTTIDATCPDVTRTHDLIRAKEAEGYEVIYIGKKDIQNQKERLV